ncbi:hypothetical protein [uncultured Ruminococcus sp.]|uniref:hypothetical protein n=1 Tax=uncultured Ruminococcus sp. TaxID=165186 RepID=UPI0026329C9C|nr:hypothetical protein [uncultured Ruminococcus sp.]
MRITNEMIYQKLVLDVFSLNDNQIKELCKITKTSIKVFSPTPKRKREIWIDLERKELIENLYKKILIRWYYMSPLKLDYDCNAEDELQDLDIILCGYNMEEMCDFFILIILILEI